MNKKTGRISMRDEDKPFVCFRQSKWIFQISPRNAEGWRGLGIWLIPFFAGTAVFTGVIANVDQSGVSATSINLTATLPFLVGTVIWSIAMIRWMLARSELLDANDLMKIKREHDRAKKRSGR
jgi:hypothetical protein